MGFEDLHLDFMEQLLDCETSHGCFGPIRMLVRERRYYLDEKLMAMLRSLGAAALQVAHAQDGVDDVG